tara:strand:- start:207 stop:545 length:339 start_codon:yes stop_codon:yes gene_type:complete
MNKKNPFVVLWKTGRVYSSQAVRELPEACGIVSGSNPVIIPLAPSPTQREALFQSLSKKRKRKGSSKSTTGKSTAESISGSGAPIPVPPALPAKKRFKSAEELFTQGFGFGQ